ncbi:MAG: HDIG domain-containing metalloprotein [Candidatus Hodarchaeota archaeon]
MNTNNPMLLKAQALLSQYIEDVEILNHCEATRQKALQIAEILSAKISVDFNIVGLGAVLHDIGRARIHDVTHGYVGGQILELYDYPSSVVRIVERHVLGGFTADEAILVGLPPRSFVPESWEEKIVCVADKLGVYAWTGIDRPDLWLEKMESRFAELQQRYGVVEPYLTSMERAKHFAIAMKRLATMQ